MAKTSSMGLFFIAILLAVMVWFAMTQMQAVDLTFPDSHAEVDELESDIAMAVDVDTSTSHGDIRHPKSADLVRKCIESNGPIQVWSRNDRVLWVCQLPNGQYGVEVLKKTEGRLEEITAFIKEKLKSLEHVERYLQNSGAVKEW